MTRLPLEDRRVYGAPGHRYRPEYVCSHPFCNQRRDLELHHIWPRSFLRNQPRDWVKLPDGRVIGNLTYLCAPHHMLISENKAEIQWDEEEGCYVWPDNSGVPGTKSEVEYLLLSPQPPLSQSEVSEDGETPRSALGAVTEPHRHLSADEAVWAGAPMPGEDCPACKRRVPHPKKHDSPKTTVTKSWRLPAEEKEAREELLEATAAHLGIPTSSKFWLDKTILKMCVLVLQGPGEA